MSFLTRTLQAQRGTGLIWSPIWLGCGVGWYFALRVELDPALARWLILWGGLGLLMALVLRRWWAVSGPIFAVALVAAGLGVASNRAQMVAAPVLEFRYYGAIEGRIIAIDRSASEAVRLTLDEVRLSDVAPARTPTRVRISLHGDGPHVEPLIGLHIATTGHLSPPPGPVEPGGFDFQRHAWFLGLGAMGYTRNPTLALAEPRGGLFIQRFRRGLTQALMSRLPGEAGSVAAAITTGDRSSISAETTLALRRSNLAHLLAISGLHMGLLTGLVFMIVRHGLALWPRAALRWPTKKIGAVAALAAGAAYLLVSGGYVATQRAFVMVCVMLVAVLLNRRAISLRSVAVAALIVLLLRPEALVGPGFQMSFAATTALVLVFGALRGKMAKGWWSPVVAVLISSAVAGAATAPFAALHFNQVPHYGLIANLLSVPVMGMVVVPSALVAFALWPFGLEALGLWGMELGISWIIGVAHWVSSFSGAVSFVPAPDGLVLPILGASLVAMAALRGFSRAAALAPLALAMVFWVNTQRPDVIIAETGGLISILGPEGRALSKPRGDGFSARVWLENDGAPASQEVAAERSGVTHDGRRSWVRFGDMAVLQVRGQRALDELQGCGGAHLLILTVRDEIDRPCLVLDPRTLRSTGTVSLMTTTQEVSVVQAFSTQQSPVPAATQVLEAETTRVLIRTARGVIGSRYWTNRIERRRLSDIERPRG